MAAEGVPIRTVLHVLPHPGGGGETYVDALSGMTGYRFERMYISRSPSALDALRMIPRNSLGALRGADLVHVHGEVASAISLPLLLARPSVVTLHGLNLLRRSAGLKRQLAIANLRVIVKAATRTICVSEAEQADVLAAIGPSARRRLVVIHNGVEPSAPPTAEMRAAARTRLGIAASAAVGIYVGSLDALKDPVAIARATIKVAQGNGPLEMVFVGDGPLQGELEQLAQSSSHGVLHMVGPTRDVRPLLAAADFFVLPSWREGLSFSLLEAMSVGLTPVVSDAPGNVEAVGDAGIVVARGDVDGFAAAFGRLITSEAERVTLGRKARERVAERFSTEEMVRTTRALYDDVVGPARAP